MSVFIEVLRPVFGQDGYGPKLSGGPVKIVQGRGDYSPRKKPMGSIYLYN
jgi:hypothetical protein